MDSELREAYLIFITRQTIEETMEKTVDHVRRKNIPKKVEKQIADSRAKYPIK